jgi:hypothetical protein
MKTENRKKIQDTIDILVGFTKNQDFLQRNPKFFKNCCSLMASSLAEVLEDSSSSDSANRARDNGEERRGPNRVFKD